MADLALTAGLCWAGGDCEAKQLMACGEATIQLYLGGGPAAWQPDPVCFPTPVEDETPGTPIPRF